MRSDYCAGCICLTCYRFCRYCAAECLLCYEGDNNGHNCRCYSETEEYEEEEDDE